MWRFFYNVHLALATSRRKKMIQKRESVPGVEEDLFLTIFLYGRRYYYLSTGFSWTKSPSKTATRLYWRSALVSRGFSNTARLIGSIYFIIKKWNVKICEWYHDLHRKGEMRLTCPLMRSRTDREIFANSVSLSMLD